MVHFRVNLKNNTEFPLKSRIHQKNSYEVREGCIEREVKHKMINNVHACKPFCIYNQQRCSSLNLTRHGLTGLRREALP